MTFIIVLAVTTVVCFALRNPLHKWPLAFYGLAIAVDVLFACGSFGMLPRSIWMPLLVLVQKCMVALAMFVVVMFIGCFSTESKVGAGCARCAPSFPLSRAFWRAAIWRFTWHLTFRVCLAAA